MGGPPTTEQRAVSRHPSVRQRPPTVLLVEDETWIRIDVAHRLRAAGFNLLIAVDGRQALAVLRGPEHVDFVLTDLMMPRLNGIAWAEQIHAEFPHIRILMTSATVPTDFVLGIIDGFFPKPLDVDKLSQHLQISMSSR